MKENQTFSLSSKLTQSALNLLSSNHDNPLVEDNQPMALTVCKHLVLGEGRRSSEYYLEVKDLPETKFPTPFKGIITAGECGGEIKELYVFEWVNYRIYSKAGSSEAGVINGEGDGVALLRDAVLEDLRRGGRFTAFDKGDVQDALKDLEEVGYLSVLAELNGVLEPYDLHFGYRVVDEVALFFKNARESQSKGIVEFNDDDEVFDLALMMKVLPKFHGSLNRLERPLLLVLALAKDGGLSEDVVRLSTEDLFRRVVGGDVVRGSEAVVRVLRDGTDAYRFKHTARKALRMLRQLYELNFASFS